MFIGVRHQIEYAYERPVFIEPKTIRLTPKHDATQHLLSHELSIAPDPSGRSWSMEQDGTTACIAWFGEQRDRLTISVDSTVRTLRENPFDGIITHEPTVRLPAEYPLPLRAALDPMLALEGEAEADDRVRAWAAERAAAADHQTLGFLGEVTAWIHGNCQIVSRERGEPFTPSRTLRERRGACRDVAMLFVAACRTQGIAARFVSGYSLHGPPELTRHELHAWAEAYLPGLGWRGYDPSLGLATADGHIVLATAPDYQLAAPTAGTYRGTGVGSTMRYSIEIESGEELAALRRG